MNALGPLFDGLNNDISGPVIIYKHPSLRFYLIGELHHVNGSCPGPAIPIWDVVLRWAKLNPSKNICVVLEATVVDFSIILNSIRSSPLKTIVECVTRPDKTHPKNITIKLANIRRQPPFKIFEVIYDLNSYVACNMPGIMDVEELDRIQRDAKAFEKVFFAHVRSRKACKEFFLTMVHPINPIPEWFVDQLKVFGISQTKNPVKEMLRQIQKTDGKYYETILLSVVHLFDQKISENNLYSVGMVAAESSRRSASEYMVAQHYASFSTFWISINAIFMDIYILCLMNTVETDMFVSFTGIAHVENMISQLRRTDMIYAFNSGGVIKANDIKIGVHTPITPTTTCLMQQFLDARRVRNKKTQDS